MHRPTWVAHLGPFNRAPAWEKSQVRTDERSHLRECLRRPERRAVASASAWASSGVSRGPRAGPGLGWMPASVRVRGPGASGGPPLHP